MNNYPLSTKSSKKSKNNPEQLPSPALIERSACQNAIPLTIKPEDYKHILVNQRIFIELYYQGRVVSTAYNDYIPFMGGTLAKRLMPKVTIFLTNLDIRQIGPIKERVRKICPQCRIINILWFQQCYQQKQKVPFDSFALDVQSKKSEVQSSTHQIDTVELDQLIANIHEDAENEFKEFFKNEKDRFFQPLPKNHKRQKQDILVARDIDLGPNQQKKARPTKNENKKRRKSVSGKGALQKRQSESKRQLKSLGVEEGKELDQFEEHEQQNQKEQNKQVKQSDEYYENKIRLSSLQNLMCKYLGPQEEDENTYIKQNYSPKEKSKCIQSQENVQTTPKMAPSQLKVELEKDRIEKQSIHSAFTECQPQKYQKHRFTFSSIGTKYKDNGREDYMNIIINPRQIDRLLHQINNRSENQLVIIAFSRTVQIKAKEINAQANSHSSIRLHQIPYKLFSAFAQKVCKPLEVYFLLNPKKSSERAVYLSILQQCKGIKLKLVSYRLIEEIIAYNSQIKNAHLRSPIKLDKHRIKFLREIRLKIETDYIKGKRVTFLQSQIPIATQKKIIQHLGGLFVLKQDYLLNTNLDLIVTDRWGLKQKGIETISEEVFWKKILKLQGQCSQ